ncbi:XTP/dITP diphosphatase [uncultured Clostridium sp.]|jgi:XTP/dITP diphosphohydrolase|uniref:XTP/dITP diphosphatase n=1 Tax=uncultured Clostridium sp. TaxID=59620 RepID=UPI00261E1B12|nr:XTP/dITP diphosphatase [uncultured Clostridium sp.]
MKQFIIASNNNHKIGEIKEILKDFKFEIYSLKEKNIDIDVEEDGITFEENSKKKAIEIVEYLKNKGEKDFIVMSDDSGLEVDYLKGAPGVYSARYAGEHGNDKKNNEKLLKELDGILLEKRTAKFVCVITAINSELEEVVVRGESRGIIQNELSREEGFGYDPLFYVEEYKKTFAEISLKEKNAISHRGRALDKLKKEIEKLL